jgi:uncharacterized protein (AIM24 family)
MAIPRKIVSDDVRETFGGVTYAISGELVPVLQVDLGGIPVYFEHHILLWKDPSVNIKLKPLKGAFKRMISGVPVFLTMTDGTGRISFSRDGVGQVIALHLKPGETIDVREHQFLAATDNVAYNFTRVKGVANLLLGGTGFFIDTFHSPDDHGIRWLHGYGNLFEVKLEPNEQIDVEPGGWVYKDQTVQMETKFQGLSSGLFGGAGQVTWNRFTGPGRLGIQSMSMYLPTAN